VEAEAAAVACSSGGVQQRWRAAAVACSSGGVQQRWRAAAVPGCRLFNCRRANYTSNGMVQIIEARDGDWPLIWSLLQPVFRSGETYAFSRCITAEEAHDAWMVVPHSTYVALNDAGQVVGTYYLKTNFPGQGSHVCNCGYVVAESARGQGVASAMCIHSQELARAAGYRCMMFNFVASSNHVAVRLWKKLGFDIVGTLPGAFSHPSLGFTDAFVMFKKLV
jgi:ribosomal protein S18 acetylase RimI-like enzyme